MTTIQPAAHRREISESYYAVPHPLRALRRAAASLTGRRRVTQLRPEPSPART